MQMNPCGFAPKSHDERTADLPAPGKRTKFLRVSAGAIMWLLTEGVTFIARDGKEIITVEHGLPQDATITKIECEQDTLSVVVSVESECYLDDLPLDVEFRRRPIANLTMPDGAGGGS